MRLVNIHTLPLNTAAKSGARNVMPNEVGDFNENNRSVQSWMKLRWLVPEGEVLASRAAALTDAPSVAEMLKLRDQVAAKEVVIVDLQARINARDAEAKRVEARFSELAMKHADADAVAAELTTAKARIAELEAQIETLTAPPVVGGAGDPTTPPTAGRNRRGG